MVTMNELAIKRRHSRQQVTTTSKTYGLELVLGVGKDARHGCLQEKIGFPVLWENILSLVVCTRSECLMTSGSMPLLCARSDERLLLFSLQHCLLRLRGRMSAKPLNVSKTAHKSHLTFGTSSFERVWLVEHTREC